MSNFDNQNKLNVVYMYEWNDESLSFKYFDEFF